LIGGWYPGSWWERQLLLWCLSQLLLWCLLQLLQGAPKKKPKKATSLPACAFMRFSEIFTRLKKSNKTKTAWEKKSLSLFCKKFLARAFDGVCSLGFFFFNNSPAEKRTKTQENKTGRSKQKKKPLWPLPEIFVF
jgi:hypothetical protein